jgi:hypothetical protein
MKLPVGSARVKGISFDIVPDDTLVDVVVDQCQICSIPDPIRERYRIHQTHSVNLRFMVLNGKYMGHILYLTLYPEVSPDGTPFPGSKFYFWLQALLGKPRLQDNYIFDTDDLIAQTLTVCVLQKPKVNGMLKNIVVLPTPNESLDLVLDKFQTTVSEF